MENNELQSKKDACKELYSFRTLLKEKIKYVEGNLEELYVYFDLCKEKKVMANQEKVQDAEKLNQEYEELIALLDKLENKIQYIEQQIYKDEHPKDNDDVIIDQNVILNSNNLFL